MSYKVSVLLRKELSRMRQDDGNLFYRYYLRLCSVFVC